MTRQLTRPFKELKHEQLTVDEYINEFRKFGFQGDIDLRGTIFAKTIKPKVDKGPKDVVIVVLLEKDTPIDEEFALSTLKLCNHRFSDQIIDCRVINGDKYKTMEILLRKDLRDRWSLDADLRVYFRLQQYLAFDKVPDEDVQKIVSSKGKDRFKTLKALKESLQIDHTLYFKVEQIEMGTDKYGMRIDNLNIGETNLKRVSFQI